MGRHPFFDNAEMVTLLAERRGKVVGRVAVFVNYVHNRKYEERRASSVFECIDDLAVAHAFRRRTRAWLLQRGMTAARARESVAQLHLRPARRRFCQPPVFLMTYNPPYYAALIEDCGFAKAQDLYVTRWTSRSSRSWSNATNPR
jgi:GNAT superfamily N-acetyltransferase